METWKERLDKAFNRMRKAGLVAYQNFTSYKSGSHVMWEIYKEMEDKPRGYVFYSRQDIIRDEFVYLSYGGFENNYFTDEEVGDVIVSCLTENGLAVEWNGDSKNRIKVILK